METHTDTEQALHSRIGRRLKPGERAELLELAGDRYTLGFEFGKDWVRLRDVLPRKDVAIAADKTPDEAVTETQGTPSSPWQAVDGMPSHYQLADESALRLSFVDSDHHWHVMKDEHTIVKVEKLAEVDRALTAWFAEELERLSDRITFAKVELEAIELFDPKGEAVQNQLNKLADWKTKKLALLALQQLLPPQSIN